jgi:hypothetical protein
MNVLQENPKDSMNRWPCRKDKKILSPEQFKKWEQLKAERKRKCKNGAKKEPTRCRSLNKGK